MPLIGTAFCGWDTFDVFAVYWTENLVVGAFMLGRIATHPAAKWPAAFGILLFFLAHYGLFCFVHGVLLVATFGGAGAPDDFFAAPAHLVTTAGSSAWGLGLFALIGSHGFSFVTNWWRRERHDRPLQLFAPYRRVVVMHVVLIAGAVLVWLADGPDLLLVLLVVAKIAADVMAHRAEHRAPDGQGPGPGPRITPPPRDSATGGGSDDGDYIAIE